MAEYRLVLADSDSEYIKGMTEYLSGIHGMKIVGTADNGAVALKLIESEQPDIVMIDLLLPEIDGIALLKSLQKMKHMPVVICVSRFYTSISVELARRNGASYYVYKPIKPKALVSIARECAEMADEKRRIEQNDREFNAKNDAMRKIHAVMCDIGFSTRFSGSGYIATAVALAMESPMLLHNLSAGLYRMLAQQMNTSPACIERSMRTAIAAADADGKLEALVGGAPTNKACIRYILRALNIQL